MKPSGLTRFHKLMMDHQMDQLRMGIRQCQDTISRAHQHRSAALTSTTPLRFPFTELSDHPRAPVPQLPWKSSQIRARPLDRLPRAPDDDMAKWAVDMDKSILDIPPDAPLRQVMSEWDESMGTFYNHQFRFDSKIYLSGTTTIPVHNQTRVQRRIRSHSHTNSSTMTSVTASSAMSKSKRNKLNLLAQAAPLTIQRREELVYEGDRVDLEYKPSNASVPRLDFSDHLNLPNLALNLGGQWGDLDDGVSIRDRRSSTKRRESLTIPVPPPIPTPQTRFSSSPGEHEPGPSIPTAPPPPPLPAASAPIAPIQARAPTPSTPPSRLNTLITTTTTTTTARTTTHQPKPQLGGGVDSTLSQSNESIRTSLLDSIRSAGGVQSLRKTRPVVDRAVTRASSNGGAGMDLMSSLVQALQLRRKGMADAEDALRERALSREHEDEWK